jgi:predicted acetyltransferase
MELLANETTLNQVAPLVEYAFNKSASVTSDPHFMNRYRHAWLYGHYTDEVLSNFVMANQFHVAFHGESLPMAGIGYVVSLPEFRGKGEMTHLFRDLLADLQASD